MKKVLFITIVFTTLSCSTTFKGSNGEDGEDGKPGTTTGQKGEDGKDGEDGKSTSLFKK